MNEFIIEHKLIASTVLITALLLLRWLIVWRLNRMPADEDDSPKRWINSVKNASNLLIAVGLIIIWLTELRYAALSIAAFAVAFVVATREFIQSFLGTVYQASSRAFAIGDWIKIGPVCGQVVRSDWLSTTLLEIDMETLSYGYTGKTVVIPNNRFLTDGVQNLNFMRRYVAHSFAIICDPGGVNVFDAKAMILQQASSYCAPFKQVAARYSDLIAKRLGVDTIGPEPSVRITTNATAKNVFTITIFCPTREAVNIEQQLTEDFMRFWYSAAQQCKQPSASNKE